MRINNKTNMLKLMEDISGRMERQHQVKIDGGV